jgi:hypothetical protein
MRHWFGFWFDGCAAASCSSAAPNTERGISGGDPGKPRPWGLVGTPLRGSVAPMRRAHEAVAWWPTGHEASLAWCAHPARFGLGSTPLRAAGAPWRAGHEAVAPRRTGARGSSSAGSRGRGSSAAAGRAFGIRDGGLGTYQAFEVRSCAAGGHDNIGPPNRARGIRGGVRNECATATYGDLRSQAWAAS